MTLTELRYFVTLARECHFGRAAAACFVSQPTLSVAIRRLEEELGATLFERKNNDIQLTPVGARLTERAWRVLNEAAMLKEAAKQGSDPLQGPLKLGAIFTVGPYLLPQLTIRLRKLAPQMQLLIQENYTARLAELLAQGDLDAVIAALPFDPPGTVVAPLYEEPFVVAVPNAHPLAAHKTITATQLQHEAPLMLGSGHCLRDQILEQLPALTRDPQNDAETHQWEGSSLETLRQMVASGSGISIFPSTAVPAGPPKGTLVSYVPFASPAPRREVVLAWRDSFTRPRAIEVLRGAIAACDLPGARRLAATSARTAGAVAKNRKKLSIK
ncbi:MAG TPA: hydrogen peroxide-inducible genes activator [Gammaproteobacteria bacterium]|nr:hydrogen peroxide-inducible genes activator [Gammaproteobacteria bacterium]